MWTDRLVWGVGGELPAEVRIMTVVTIGGLEVAFWAEDRAGATHPRGPKYVICLEKQEEGL